MLILQITFEQGKWGLSNRRESVWEVYVLQIGAHLSAVLYVLYIKCRKL